MKPDEVTVLRINLTTGEVGREALSPSISGSYIGGKGLGIRLNYEENPPEMDAFSPANRIILAVGPGAGTSIPTAVRTGLYTKAPLNDVGVDSYVGGSFGHFMRKAGYSILIIEGKAPHPVYIRIVDDEVDIEDAADLWGMDIYTTEKVIKESFGGKARVLSIGPAGERLIRYACVGHDYNRHFGRMGAGAVFGSKNLKAVAVVGTGAVKVFDPAGLKKYVRDLNRRIKEHPGTGTVYPLAGTVSFVSKANDLHVFPSHYWHRGEAKSVDRIDFEYMSRNTLVRQTRCFGCTIGCAHVNRVRDGRYKGIEIDGPEYETIYVFGGLCDVEDIRDIIKLNDVCDRLGIDTMHAGNVLGLLMDATEQNRLPEKYRIAFGDTEKMLKFLNNTVEREDEWFVVGEGLREVADRFGLQDLVIHVKGLEPAGYDPRGLQSMAVTFGVGNRGASHLSTNAYARDISGTARDFEISGEDKSVDRLSLEGKAELVYNMSNFNAIADCFILCRFLNRDLLTWEDYSEMLRLLTGSIKGRSDLEEIANNIITLGRWYNIKTGLTMEDDYLPERFYSEKNQDKTTVSKAGYTEEIRRYYEMRNWDEEGIPRFHPQP